jgi:hypothetical protein
MHRLPQLWQARAMHLRFLRIALCATLLSACAGSDDRQATPAAPIGLTPPEQRADAPVVRREIAEAPIPPVASVAPRRDTPSIAAPSAPAVVVPADAIYVCVVDRDGTRTQTVIKFVPKVHQLCRRHPEMGPCQYERNVCRAAGVRVFAASWQEITLAVEAEYDRRVTRTRFRAN